jgi:heme-degrading monooxygenase HmoA
MIARIWHGRTQRTHADAYFAVLQQRAIPDYESVPGNRAVHILRREEGDVCHFLTISLWDSLEGIKQFAGENIEQAKYYPKDQAFLLEFEPTVVHYEAASAVNGLL